MNKLRLRPRLAALLTTSIVCLCLLALSSAPAWAKVGAIKEFPIPTTSSGPVGITVGPDGNLWFTETRANKIGRITTRGRITEFPLPLPLPFGGPFGITAGPDGNLWFTEQSPPNAPPPAVLVDKIGKITTSGSITEFPFPTLTCPPILPPPNSCGRTLAGITAGSDGNLWFTESSPFANAIGRITTSGSITEFPLPTPFSGPFGITAGPDSNLWFTENSGNKIGPITTSGSITEFPTPTAPGGNIAVGITAGPDGNLWFTEDGANEIGRITTAGVITVSDEFPIPTPFSGPRSITAGPDGNLWFTESGANKIGRITTSGSITEFPIPTASSGPFGITAGPAPTASAWFTEETGNKIGRIST